MALKSVSTLVLDNLAVFEFGVICEVFGIDRSGDGVPNFDFKVCGPEPGKPLRTSVGASITPDHGLDDLVGADLVAIPAIGGADYLPEALDAVSPAVIVLLNLSRDQLDRVGEINHIERTLRAGLARHPGAVVVAHGDDVLMTSAAYDHPNVVWVAAGGGWASDSVSCPRSGETIVRDGAHWHSAGCNFKRPTPAWSFDDTHIHGPDGLSLPMALTLPGTVNRGNATQAVAA